MAKTSKKTPKKRPKREKSAYQIKHDAFLDEHSRKQTQIARAEVFHVNAGGIGEGPIGIAPTAEADISIVTLTSRHGARITVQWDDQSGGFQIRTIHAERLADSDHLHDAYVSAVPVASNCILIIPATTWDYEKAQHRAARRGDL